ncbi:hypothetical protein BH10BAC6_BH10BAC6_13130 [soil metagenome]
MVWPASPSRPCRPARFTACSLAWLLFVFFTLSSGLHAQTETTNWYFGDLAGVTFRNGTAESLSDGMISTNEGCAAISDPTSGALLFYTDGATVYNRLHEVMVGGTGLNGDVSTSQSAIIVPQPGNPFVFYIFNPAPITSAQLNGRCFCLWMSVVDLRKQGGYGEVVRKNEQLATDITEHITATKNCAGDGYWIVVHSKVSRHFYSFQLTRDRLEPVPMISDAGDPTLSVRDAGQMHISPDSRKLALTSAAGNSQVFEFDYATGRVYNGTTLFPSSIVGSHYGAAFSQDSRKLYIAVSNQDDTTPATVYQFTLDQLRSIDIVSSRKVAARLSGTYSWTPMQLALDGSIYISRAGRSFLSRISLPQNEVDSCGFIDTALVLTGQCRSGLPNMIGSMLRPPNVVLRDCKAPQANFSTDTICAGTCIEFKDKSLGTIDSWEWLFDNAVPSISTQRDPGSVCYARAGTYAVYLIVKNAYGADTVMKSIEVKPHPKITIDPVPVICAGTSITLRANGGVSYSWFPPSGVSNPTSASPSVAPIISTTFIVTVRGANGCSDTASVVVRVATPSAGPDVSICGGGSVRMRASGASTYEWSPSTGLSNASVADPVASPTTTTVYTVRMKAGDCETVDTVVVTVASTLEVTVVGQQEICAGESTVVSIQGGSSIVWQRAAGISDTASFTPTFDPRVTTTYRYTISSGSCVLTDSITITVYPLPMLSVAGATTVCPGDSVLITATIAAGTTIVWQPSAGLSDSTSTSPKATPSRSTMYRAVVRSAQGCVAIDSVLIRVEPTALVSAGPDKSICPGGSVQISGTGVASTYAWTPTTGLSDPTSLAPTASPFSTTTYILMARTGSCSVIDSVTVFVSNISIDVRAVDTICRGSALELKAQGGVRYSWTPTIGLSDPTIANPIASPNLTTTYTVRATDQFDCTAEKSTTVVVKANTPIKLRLGSVVAGAGVEEASMLIFAETADQQLPLHIDSLSAEIRFDASVFLPLSIDRGRMQVGIQSDERVLFVSLSNIDLLISGQRLADVRGVILLGAKDTARTRWVDARWSGDVCPSIETSDGYIFVSGCFLRGRAFREFAGATLSVGLDQDNGVATFEIGGTEVGDHTISLVSVNGQRVWTSTFNRQFNDATPKRIQADVSSLATGVYVVQLESPMGPQTLVIPLLR